MDLGEFDEFDEFEDLEGMDLGLPNEDDFYDDDDEVEVDDEVRETDEVADEGMADGGDLEESQDSEDSEEYSASEEEDRAKGVVQAMMPVWQGYYTRVGGFMPLEDVPRLRPTDRRRSAASDLREELRRLLERIDAGRMYVVEGEGDFGTVSRLVPIREDPCSTGRGGIVVKAYHESDADYDDQRHELDNLVFHQLRSPRVYCAVEWGGQRYVFMEYVVDACKWFNIMHGRGNYAAIDGMIRQIGETIMAMRGAQNSEGHNDLKCANIGVNCDGRAVLFDYSRRQTDRADSDAEFLRILGSWVGNVNARNFRRFLESIYESPRA